MRPKLSKSRSNLAAPMIFLGGIRTVEYLSAIRPFIFMSKKQNYEANIFRGRGEASLRLTANDDTIF
jgi:hypothetical protein